MLNGVQLGPMSEADVRALPITGETPVWSEGFPDWKPACQVEAFAGMFGGMPGQAYSQAAPHSAYSRPQPQYQQSAYSQPYSQNDMPPMPQTYLVWSILVTILCCIPLGIVAIVYSSGVESAYNQGNYALAQAKSRKALNWIIASVVCGFVVGILQVIYALSIGMFSLL